MTQSIRDIERLARGRDTGQVVIHFPSDGFLLTQIVIGVLFSVYAFKEYVDGTIGTLSIPILMGGGYFVCTSKT